MSTPDMPFADPQHRAANSGTGAVLDRQRGVLPVPLTALVGREAEVAAARDALLAHDVRLVSLIGPGGVGKTRVAIQVTWELADAFAGDVHLIRLATLDDTDLFLPAIAQALDLPDPGTSHPIDILRSGILNRPALLFLDSFEPILSAAPLLADLLSACPQLKALVTSRERLKLRGERVLRISPLATPSPAEFGTSRLLQQNPAVRLMAQQAREVVPDFRINDDNAGAIAAIVCRLDGLPLAIELAAARLVLFPPDALLSRLERRLALLSGGASDLPDRLRTMRDAIAWSYDLLTVEERRLFRRLSVFANGFTFEAAEFLEGNDQGHKGSLSYPAVLNGIASLLDKSLLFQDATAGQPRYAMLDTIREFGLEQLAACEELDAIRQGHATWFLALAERAAEDRHQNRDTSAWLDRLEVDHDNLRAALAWYEHKDDTDGFVRLAAALSLFWLYHSHRTEEERWLIRAVERARGVGLCTIARAQVLDGAAELAFTQGEYERAKILAAEYLAVSQEINHLWGSAAALNLLGIVARAEGAFDRAAQLFTEALTLLQRETATDWAAQGLRNLGTVAYWQGAFDRATALGTEALPLFRRQNDYRGAAMVLSDLALVATHGPDRADTAALFLESLAEWRKVGNLEGLVDWLPFVSTLAISCQQHELGVWLLTAAERAADTIGYRFEPPELSRQEQALNMARSTLGEPAFTAALAEGRLLTLEPAMTAATEFLIALHERATAAAPQGQSTPYGLTPRELEVLRLLIDGRTDRQIGEILCISHRTAMRHVEHILTKLEVDSRTAAATQAVRLGLV